MDSILVRGREIAERHNQDGDGFKNVGRKNAFDRVADDVWSQSQAQKAKKA